jgi:hypothetical protein
MTLNGILSIFKLFSELFFDLFDCEIFFRIKWIGDNNYNAIRIKENKMRRRREHYDNCKENT